jgi:hypothetical protein
MHDSILIFFSLLLYGMYSSFLLPFPFHFQTKKLVAVGLGLFLVSSGKKQEMK